MATTTNFGWETPDDTDLVKDGALAIRTLGSAIDTSLVDLKGGTTGQVLSKTSNTDMDFTWVTSDDANAIQNAIVDAKGDLITATAADTPARLPVGTNGQVLKADSSTATGLAWGSASSSFVGAYLYRGSDKTIANSTATAVDYNNETFDTDGFHDNVTNNTRLTIPTGKGGKYLFYAKVRWANSATGARFGQFKINNTTSYNALRAVGQLSGDTTIFTYSDIYNLSDGDYVEHIVLQQSGGNLNLEGGSAVDSAFGCIFLGA
jgi:hypothetical protein